MFALSHSFLFIIPVSDKRMQPHSNSPAWPHSRIGAIGSQPESLQQTHLLQLMKIYFMIILMLLRLVHVSAQWVCQYAHQILTLKKTGNVHFKTMHRVTTSMWRTTSRPGEAVAEAVSFGEECVRGDFASKAPTRARPGESDLVIQ